MQHHSRIIIPAAHLCMTSKNCIAKRCTAPCMHAAITALRLCMLSAAQQVRARQAESSALAAAQRPRLLSMPSEQSEGHQQIQSARSGVDDQHWNQHISHGPGRYRDTVQAARRFCLRQQNTYCCGEPLQQSCTAPGLLESCHEMRHSKLVVTVCVNAILGLTLHACDITGRNNGIMLHQLAHMLAMVTWSPLRFSIQQRQNSRHTLHTCRLSKGPARHCTPQSCGCWAHLSLQERQQQALMLVRARPRWLILVTCAPNALVHGMGSLHSNRLLLSSGRTSTTAQKHILLEALMSKQWRLFKQRCIWQCLLGMTGQLHRLSCSHNTAVRSALPPAVAVQAMAVRAASAEAMTWMLTWHYQSVSRSP